jgi:hypothetical protein
MRTWLLTIGTVVMLLLPFAVRAADYGASASNIGAQPPVAQPLVREGDFAIKLAVQLNVGNPADEADAADMLARNGVAPVNGWLSDYPVTPQIIGQLQESVSRAASEGKLQMTADQAVGGLFSVSAQYNLPTTPDQRASAPDNGAQTAQPPKTDQAVINNYYGTYGPPIVTYYPPPPDYLYLYAWVPYPYWWFGFWYPGFYICNNFTTVVVVRPGVRAVVTNRFIDHDTRRGVVVDPNGSRRTGRGGRERPESVLRTGQGHRYRSFADMHNGVRVTGPPASGNSRGERDRGRGAGKYSPEGMRRGAESGNYRSMTGSGERSPRAYNSTPFQQNRSLPPGPANNTYNRQQHEHGWENSVPSRIYTGRPTLSGSPDQERRSAEPARPSGGYERQSWQATPGSIGRGGSQMRPFIGKRISGHGRGERGGGPVPSNGVCRGGRC